MAEAAIYRDLKADHDKQRALLAKLADTKGKSKERQTLFETLRLELQAHAAAEEESLYAAMLANPDLRDDARHSVSEHKEVEDALGELMGLEMGTDEWEETFFHLKRRYLHHIDEEEEEMFPAAAKALPDVTEERLAATYETRKPEELKLAKAHPPASDHRE